MSTIYVSNDGVNKMCRGGSDVNRMYRGTRKVFEMFDDGSPQEGGYLCFTANTANSTVGMEHTGTNATTTKPVIYVSTDKENWTLWDYSTITLANVNDKLYMYGANPDGISNNSTNYSNFVTSGRVAVSGDCTCLINQSGTNSLPYHAFYKLFLDCTTITTAPSLPATTLGASCYHSMFMGCTALTAAPALPATTLAEGCYYYMFNGCTSLTAAPQLPATTMAELCYDSMFRGCTSLTTAPVLQSTSLALKCYGNMFKGCTSLVTAPVLPATVLSNQCYASMFEGCTSLTTAPTLPATTVPVLCYDSMFKDCTSLTTAPALPAETLTQGCYSYMFDGCSQLNSVICLATNISATDCTKMWLSGVAMNGTFTKALSMNDWTSGNSGIPAAWTIDTYTKNITFSGSDEPFSYTIGTTTTNVTVGTSIVETLAYPQSVSVTTAGIKYHLEVNGTDKGNGPAYTLDYLDLSNGDVLTCVYDNEPS